VTVLSDILDTVLDETGFDQPSSYFGNTSQAARRARAMANASIRDLVNLKHRALIKTEELSLTTAQLYDMPADFHGFITDTMYEDGETWPADFPTSDQAYALLKTSGINSGIFLNVRVIGNQLEVFDPVDGNTLVYTYRSNHPVQATGGGSTKPKYTADTDVWLLDDDLHTLDIIWRWKKLHGMDYQDDLAMYKRYEKNYLARDGGYRSLQMNGSDFNYYPAPQFDPWVD